jgi:hypothetical protein
MDAVLLGKMLDAGFTKEEIMKLIPAEPMTSLAEAAANDPEPVEPEPAEKTEPEQKAPDPEPGPAADNNAAMEKRLSGIEKSISDLMKMIQAENRKHDSIGGLPESLDEETDRIMKGIIRPETKRKDV